MLSSACVWLFARRRLPNCARTCITQLTRALLKPFLKGHRMKILLVNHFPLEGSGSGTYTMNTAQHLAKRGNEVCVVFPENQQPRPLEGVELRPVFFDGSEHGIPTEAPNALPFNFPCFTTHPRSLTTFNDLNDEQLQQYLDAFAAALESAVQEFKPDIIHAQHVWLLANVAAKTGVPTVITAHGTDMMGYRKWPRFRALANEAVQLCRCVIAISKDNIDDTVETIPAAAPKVKLLLNGYNEDIFYRETIDKQALLDVYGVPRAQKNTPTETNTAEKQNHAEQLSRHNEQLSNLQAEYNSPRIVLFAGKLTNFKGVDTLLKAAARYEAKHPNIVTLIAGDGEERKPMEALHKQLGLTHTYFLGHQQQDSLRRLLNVADVLAMPSRREPFGLSALEAMACGLPVVATSQGGLPEFVTPEAGTLVEVDDDAALAQAILSELKRNKENPARKEHIARNTHEHYAQSKFVVRLEALYQKAIA